MPKNEIKAEFRRTFARFAAPGRFAMSGARGCLALLAALCCLNETQMARAQTVANVSAVQRITEKKAGATAWREAGNGTALRIDDAFRTGKRSKADIKFTDGSLLRLGQLSSVEFKSAKGVRLLGGQLLYTALKPGRVLAGTAAAEIKGSVCSVRLNADGSVDIELYSGAADVVTPGKTLTLAPGQGVSVSPLGILSQVRAASPRAFMRGSPRGELLDRPSRAPFVGSRNNEIVRIQPERLALQEYEGVQTNLNAAVVGNPFIPKGTRPSPFPPPIPTTLPPAPGTAPGTGGTPLPPGLPVAGTRVATNALGARAVPGDAAADRDVAVANDVLDASVFDTSAAEKHLGEGNRALGRTFGADVFGIGVLSDGGTQLYGGRFHGFGASGKLYYDIAVQPLRARVNGRTQDYSSFPSAFVNYRDRWGDVQVGRQRFVAGPTQATLFGSMVRAGSREVMDAARFEPTLKNGQRLEVAYIYDAFVRNLPYKFGGPQHALYGRYSVEKPFANLGLNLFRYSNAPVNSTTGVTLDFAVPIVRDKIEFYGELGRDPFRRRLTTFGLAFPGLYDRTGIEALLEYANLGNSSSAVRPPNELTARFYKRIGSHFGVVASASRFSGGDGNFTLGLSYGARISGTGDAYGQSEMR